mgnify:CR=1 FL=1|jgi:YggT family protein
MWWSIYQLIMSFVFWIPMAILFLRILFPLVRAPFSDPMVGWIYTVTNPLMRPLERFIPRYRNLHLAAVLLFIAVSMLSVAVIGLTLQPRMLIFGGLERALGFVYFFLIALLILYVLMSFVVVRRGNFFVELVGRVVGPPIRWIRARVPPIGPFDLSPMLLILALTILWMLLSAGLWTLAGVG